MARFSFIFKHASLVHYFWGGFALSAPLREKSTSAHLSVRVKKNTATAVFLGSRYTYVGREINLCLNSVGQLERGGGGGCVNCALLPI